MRLFRPFLLGAAILALMPSAAIGQSRVVQITQCGGTLANAGVAQTITTQDTQRAYLTVQNPIAATEALYVDFGVAATVATGNSIELSPGGSVTFMSQIPVAFVSVNAATAGHRFICKAGK